MSQLIHMRQRIKTIETIQKITHAMRLIAMSSHTKLKLKHLHLKRYCTEVEQILATVAQHAPHWTHHFLKKYDHKPELFIVVSSQKGLCGTFNSAIMHLFRQTVTHKKQYDVITVGKRAHDFVVSRMGIIPILSFDNFSTKHYLTIAHKIISYLCTPHEQYSKVTVVNSFAKSFFNQVPQLHSLLPFNMETFSKMPIDETEYLWDDAPPTLLDQILKQHLMAKLSNYFFETLVAELAARFLSMDNSTRNAKKVLEETRLLYNKSRQAKITKELIEFSYNTSEE